MIIYCSLCELWPISTEQCNRFFLIRNPQEAAWANTMRQNKWFMFIHSIFLFGGCVKNYFRILVIISTRTSPASCWKTFIVGNNMWKRFFPWLSHGSLKSTWSMVYVKQWAKTKRIQSHLRARELWSQALTWYVLTW